MRIEYKILWVEDVEDWFKDSKGLLDDFLENLGFVSTVRFCKSFKEVEEEYSLNQLKEYDIVFVDFKLASSQDGDVIIDFIRKQDNNSILTDIIFYSSDIESVRDKLKENGFEGVYTSLRKEFIDKAEKVIKSTIKKVQEVNSMRGLIMAETSDLDELMLEITLKMLNTEQKEVYEKYILEEVISTIERDKNKAIDKSVSISDKVRISKIFTSFHKAKCINKLYKTAKIGQDQFFERYKQVIFIRNNFAHVKESVIDGEKVLISHSSGKEIIFNESECIKIRKTLIEFRKELEEINEQL